MTATVLSILPKPRGRPAGDGRGVLRLFPHHCNDRAFIYAMAFPGDVVKVGKTKAPRTRLNDQWRSIHGQVMWVHLFASMHPTVARWVEGRVTEAFGKCSSASQLNNSEWCFVSVTRAEIINIIRPLIDECRREMDAVQWIMGSNQKKAPDGDPNPRAH